jgi:hypothetical protein
MLLLIELQVWEGGAGVGPSQVFNSYSSGTLSEASYKYGGGFNSMDRGRADDDDECPRLSDLCS